MIQSYCTPRGNGRGKTSTIFIVSACGENRSRHSNQTNEGKAPLSLNISPTGIIRIECDSISAEMDVLAALDGLAS